jgi:hypothetical protein
MSESGPADPRPGWVRQRTRELHQSGLGWIAARKQAEAEAGDKFGSEENGDNGNGASA